MPNQKKHTPFLSFTRKGCYVKIIGSVVLSKKKNIPQEIYIQVGARQLICSVETKEDSINQVNHCNYNALYRVGFGIKYLKVVARLPDGSIHTLARRWILSGPENIGAKIKIPSRKSRLIPGINLVGPMQYELGLGEASRGLYRAIHTSDIPITPFAPPITLNAPITVDFNKKILGRNLTHELTVFHLNPPEMEHIRKFWPRALNSYQYTVGYWYFELPKLPNSWIAGFHGLKEIWVATRFVYDTVNRNSPIPVYIIPPLVQVSDPGFVNKSEFGLPQNSVCVLFTFDLNSYKTRKNPDASIAAFRLAVKSTPDLHLILKINNADKNWGAMSEIQNLLLGINSFTIITEVYSRKTLTRLQAACDIFLSLHRSEGFGLNLAECMALGKPVVATGWSGNMDFMNEQNSCPVKYTLVELNETYGPYEQGQTWAEPSIEDAAEKLINLANSENLRIEIGQKARATIESNYSAAIVSDAVRKRITTIQKSAANETTTPC